MNTRLCSVLLLSAALSATAFATTPAPVSSVEFEVSKASMRNGEVEHGVTELMVRAAFGKPDEQLSPDVWVYRRFYPDTNPDTEKRIAAKGCNILLVEFAMGKVNTLKLVNQPAVEKVVASLKLDRSLGKIATTQ